MTTKPERIADAPSSARRYVPMVVAAVAAALVLLIPLKIIGFGFMPPDDALADAAKAVSGKSWPEILVLKADYAIDNHIGWHTLLRWLYVATRWNDESLAVFSMTGLFALLGWSALPWLRRSEAWLITLGLTLGVQSPFMRRFMLGRPFVWSMVAVISILFLWRARGSRKPDARCLAAMTGLIGLAVLLHGVWYFWALPVAAFFLARQFRWGAALGGCWLAGSLLGAALTGHPVVYLLEAWRQAWNVIGLHATQNTLVTELRPTVGNWFPLLMAGGLLVLRQLAHLRTTPWSLHPAFWLACLGWVLGFRAERFWDDWGMPGLMVLMASELDAFLDSRLAADSLRRLALSAGLAATVFIMTTSDADNRWSGGIKTDYVQAGEPNLAGWLPGEGGIFYETDMEFFYMTFFKNPTAPWRYSTGFEPAFMPADDFATYLNILSNNNNPDAYRPWIQKMRPEDRLVLSARGNPAAFLPELEWKQAVGMLWLGRLPRPAMR